MDYVITFSDVMAGVITLGLGVIAFRRTDSNSEYNIDIESNGVEVIVE